MFHPARIEILAPDADSAFALEKRLMHLSPTAIGAGLGWSVELEDADDRLEEIEAIVRHWLRATGLRSTLIRVDGDTTVVNVGHWEELPLGAGYDVGVVLTHEP